MEKGVWWATVRGVTESDTTEWLTLNSAPPPGATVKVHAALQG